MENKEIKNTIIPFSTNEYPTINQVGGKGYSLIKLTSLNLEVPSGVILTVDFFSEWINSIKATPLWDNFIKNKNGSDIQSVLVEIKKWCLSNLKLFKKNKSGIEKFLSSQDEKYKNEIYAVRSSSPEEDLEGASFAGGYETYLGVCFEDLEQFILKTFVSCLDYRIFKYKVEKNFNPYEIKIAIIIMKQIKSEISGVGFSVNPINNDYDEAVITSNFGLGETVVGGIVTPDEYIVNKITRKIINSKIGKKEKIITLSKNNIGTQISDSNESISIKSSLDEKIIIEIVDAINYIEKNYGCPIDIEFAIENKKLYILQARPITTYNKIPKNLLTEPNENRQLYMDVTLLIQGFTKPMSLLGIELIKKIANNVFLKITGSYDFANFRDSVGGAEGGKILINLSNLWTLVSKEKTINFFKILSTAASNIISSLGDKYENKEIPYKMNVSKFGMAWRMPIFRIFFCNWFAESSINNFQYYFEVLNENTKKYIESLNNNTISFTQAINSIAEETGNCFRSYVAPVMYNALIHYSSLQKLFEPLIKENKEIKNDLNQLLKCLPNNVTTVMGIELYKVSLLIDKEQYKDESFEQFKEDFHQHKLSNNFYNAYKQYIERYGFRGQGELDISIPRGYETPDIILNQIYALVKSNENELNPIALFEKTEKERPKVFERLRLIARQHNFESDFVYYYKICIKYLAYRESPKYYLIRLLSHFRPVILKYAKEIFIKQGLIENVDDIWKLSLDSFEKISASPSNYSKNKVSQIIEKDSESRNLFLSWKRVPPIFDSRGRFFTQSISNKRAKENELIGETVSWGVAKGKAKVMRQVNEKEFLPGEILVTTSTDPGWTPLIINSGGIVLEVGGMLQHGALVSREFNKPCVVGIDNVMEIIKDGDEIEVDAINGIVRICK